MGTKRQALSEREPIVLFSLRIRPTMLTFMFWNICGKPNEERIARLARRHDVDVLILAECRIVPNVLLPLLNRGRESAEYHYHANKLCDLINVYSRFALHELTIGFEAARYTIRLLELPDNAPVAICMAHISSKLHYTSEEQTTELVAMSREIREFEEKQGSRRTIVVGDMNVNPFEAGMTKSDGLHAVMTRGVANKQSRTVNQRDYPFFYNPMWSHFGDGNNTPPGTYYQWKSTPHTYFWNMFDQVLIRPDLLPHFEDKDLQIVITDTDGQESLLRDGIPNKGISDHLPIVFKLRLAEEEV